MSVTLSSTGTLLVGFLGSELLTEQVPHLAEETSQYQQYQLNSMLKKKHSTKMTKVHLSFPKDHISLYPEPFFIQMTRQGR